MARFSERVGAKTPKTILQVDSMDDDLRNGLWNVCYEHHLKAFLGEHFYPPKSSFVGQLWHDYFRLPIDEIPYEGRDALARVKGYYFKAGWAEVYDIIEFLAPFKGDSFTKSCNWILERELSAYRFSGSLLVRITDEQELATIQQVLDFPDLLKPVRRHIRTAVELFSDRKNPDYRNSIKESISAVEAMCKILTGEAKATLGQALKKLEDKGIELHASLRNSFSSLYGYTNDAEGIRHALLEEPTLDFDDAKFMLVSCSAFVNYLAAKASKAGVVTAGK
jgi:AbiJ N-terminal domain 4